MAGDHTQQSPGAPPASSPEQREAPHAASPELALGPELSSRGFAPEPPDSSLPPPLPVDAELERALVEALATPASAPPGVLIDGKYVVLSLLGEGGMSRVFEAKNHLTGRHVALKWLHGQSRATGVDPHRLIQEARATSRIEHPNVVQVFDLGFVAGQPYLVMELLRGEALDLFLARLGPLPELEAAAWLEPVLGAAQRFHEAGVVHRDLKPANLFVVQDGVSPPFLKILDFGIASLVPNAADGEESLLLTQPGMALGTPFYMAPEQLRREKADARSDVFALGCILYEMSTGERPFPARDLGALLELLSSEHAEDRRERLASTMPLLGDVLARALALDPNDRFQSAEEFRQALRAVTCVAAVPSVRAEPSHPRRRRWRAALLVAALLIMGLLITRWVPWGVARDPASAQSGSVMAGHGATDVTNAANAELPVRPPAPPVVSSAQPETEVLGLRPAPATSKAPAPALDSARPPLRTSSGRLDESEF